MLDDNAKWSKKIRHEIFNEDTYRLKRLFKSGKKFDVILDIGANVGWFFNLANALFSGAKIICVEPSPRNMSFLKQNTANNPVELVHLALGNGSGDKLYFLQHGSNHGASMCYDKPVAGAVEVDTIDYKWLYDNYLKNAKSSFVKIDCEGGENNILDHPEYFDLFNDVSYLAMEIHAVTSKEGLEQFIEHIRTRHTHHIEQHYGKYNGMLYMERI